MTTIAGRGLHSGAASTVRVELAPGPVRLNGVLLERFLFDGAARSTAAVHPDFTIRTVEHLFAALGGLGIFDGVALFVDGPEVPLVDGGARAFVDALASAPRSRSRWVVAREGMIELGASRYLFRPAPAVAVTVEVDFEGAPLDRFAAWHGEPDDFRDRVAGARTFGFDHEVQDLLARGLAQHVTPESVVVITRDGVLSAGPPFAPDEPARHKLLDLIGDLYAHGGPPRGEVRAVRPGHAATHEAVRKAIASGVIALAPQ